MEHKLISSAHIQKLGMLNLNNYKQQVSCVKLHIAEHRILEIRERALHAIISKLDRGHLYDNDLARTKEILWKLFKWFALKPLTNEEIVLHLIKRMLLVGMLALFVVQFVQVVRK